MPPKTSKQPKTGDEGDGARRPPKPLQPEPLERWVEKTRRLLARERDEELALAQQELAALDDRRNPNVLPDLRLAQRSTALFGRALLKFALPKTPKPHQFTVGDLVQLRLKASPTAEEKKTRAFPTGIVARVEETAISVALGENEDLDEDELLASNDALTLDRLVNNATFAKISSALEQLTKFDYGAAQGVVDVCVDGSAVCWW